MKLIDDWKTSYKHFSKQALALLAAMHALAALYPETMPLHVPFLTGITYADALSRISTLVAALGIVGGLIAQTQGDPE